MTNTSANSSTAKLPKVDLQQRPSFVIECRGQPILALATKSLAAAESFCRNEWLASELAVYRSGGRPVWDGKDLLIVRPATPFEHAKVLAATVADEARNEDTKFVFAFLIPIDPDLN